MLLLIDDYALLEMMLEDAKSQNELYRPGTYWLNNTRVAANHIRKYGVGDFRGSSSLIGLSFADNIFVDTRKNYDFGILRKTLKLMLEKVFPFSKTFDSQVSLTKSYAEQMLRYKRETIANNPRTAQLLSKYNLPFSSLGGCTDYVIIDGEKISSHYLNLLDQIDRVVDKVNFSNAKCYFEIGGGFGCNVHLLLENYKNLKKIIYLDIPPNLYTGTQYLKAFFGDAVKDYSQTRNLKEISFENNNDLELLVIAPWQIEKIKAKVDIFWNSHSFVEMPENIVSNYARHINEMLTHSDSSVVLISYDGFDLKTTFDPDRLPNIFSPAHFEKHYFQTFFNKERNNIYYIA